MSDAVHPYEQGHLLVAALRLFVHRHQRPPTVKELSEMIQISPEMGHFLCNRLDRLGVLEVVEAAFEERVYLRDHLKLEELPREERLTGFEAEVRKLKEDQQRQQEKIEKLRTTQEAKKGDLFSDLEKQLREGLRKRKNPLDEL